jgi:transposase
MVSKKGTKKKETATGLPIIHRHAAGLDVGSRFHVVAVPPGADAEPVRTFCSFTGDLFRLADWLKAVGITTVAMESTGVYWIPVYEMLEARGFEVVLVNARDARNVPGRKTDVNDAQWLQQLHEYGLLRGSFRPHEKMTTLRSYLRSRDTLVEYAASHVQHMQKALMQMNVQLHHAVCDITGATGMKIIRAIVNGERDAAKLAEFRDMRCKSSVETIRAALVGNYRPEHVFALQQSLELYDFYQIRISACDVQVEQCLASLNEGREEPRTPLPERRRRAHPKNEPNFEIRPALYTLAGGVDLTQIHGLGPHAALRLIGECGTDMTRWPTAKHFTSWLTLAPGSKISGGKVLSARTRRSANRATALLRLCAVTIGKTSTALGAFYRRLAARAGKAKAVTATARKLAVLFYNTLRHGTAYVDPGADYYEERFRRRTLDNLRRRADALGFQLVPAGEVGVS